MTGRSTATILVILLASAPPAYSQEGIPPPVQLPIPTLEEAPPPIQFVEEDPAPVQGAIPAPFDAYPPQDVMTPFDTFPPQAEAPAPAAPSAFTGLEAESLPAEIAEDEGPLVPEGFRLGPAPVSDVGILRGLLGLDDFLSRRGLRSFGWVESGYTGSSTGAGLLSVAPRLNRFGDYYLVNQIGLTLSKPLEQDRFNVGFNVRYFAGADAAAGQPKGGIGSGNSYQLFNHDFRDLNISAHLPVLTEGGVDFKIGRMNTIIGYNGYLSPYRPFYSSDYQFWYLQDGAFTGFLFDFHITDRLNVWSGMTLGANTFFVNRSARSYCYIGQIDYWLTEDRKTRLTASVYAGPDALFSAPGMGGTFDTMVEMRIQRNWTERFTQIIQSNIGWDSNTPVGTRGSGAYGVYTIGLFHLTPHFDFNARGEWFKDVGGVRTGFAADYAEATVGINWHPTKWLEIRPEVRGDFASQPAYGGGTDGGHYKQLTSVISTLIKF